MFTTQKFAVNLSILWFLRSLIRFPVITGTSDLHDCVFHIIEQHFPGECVCFVVDGKNPSSLFGGLIGEVGRTKSVYVVSPDEDAAVTKVTTKTTPLKPFPCYFVIDLPFVGSRMAWLFLKGGYHSGDYNLSEARYLVVAEEHHSHEEAAMVLMDMFSYGFLDVDLVNPNGSSIDVLTVLPFGGEFKSCPETTPPVLYVVGVWRNGAMQERILFPRKLPPSGVFVGCSWNISCGFFAPYIMVGTGGRYSGPLQGYDASPLSLLLERLNLTPQWTIDIWNLWATYHPQNGSLLGAVPDLILGRGAQMCCGGLSLGSWSRGNADLTHFYTWATVAWFVAAPDKVPKWTMIIIALEEAVWAAVIATSVSVPIVYWIFCVLSKQRNSLTKAFLTLISLLFSNSTGSAPINTSLRLIFVAWLFYALHVDQFYLASLTRLITNSEYEPLITTVDHLLDRKLPTAAFEYIWDSLLSSEDAKISKLVENRLVIPRVLDRSLYRMSLYKNFSIAENQVFFKYTVANMNNVSVYQTRISHDEYVIGALMWRHHYLFDRVNRLLMRMFDAGYPVYFLKRTVPNRFWTNPNDNTARAFNLRDLSGPFFILVVGLFLGFVAFSVEVVYFNWHRTFEKRRIVIRRLE